MKLKTLGTALLATLSLTATADDFKVSEIQPNLLLLANKGGNIVINRGVDGLLVIDNGYADNARDIKQHIERIAAGDSLQYIINTHWHGDHSGGNELLGREATIIAHDNVRKRLQAPQEIPLFKMKSEPYDSHGLPTLTYPDSMNIHFNGQRINLQHYPDGHTDSDTVVLFSEANVIHMGDHMFNGMFPFIDVDNQGNAVNYADNVRKILTTIDQQTIVVPGHGAITNKQGLQQFSKMLDGSIAEVKKMKQRGYSLLEAQQQGLDKQWQSWDAGFIKEPVWIGIIYRSL